MRCRTLPLALALLIAAAGPALAGDISPLPGVCSASDRFGVWSIHDKIEDYAVAQLHAGWYNSGTVDLHPARPLGLRFAQLVRIAQGEPPDGMDAACFDPEVPEACPAWEELAEIAGLHPGSLWLIGNEPDRQDYVEADRYAELYHDFYTFLKAQDPSSRVAIGGVVQPTPIRLQYLDLILDSYQAQYGEPMPVDVWNVHNYVLREAQSGWGCGIPPGTDPELAIDYGLQDHDNLAYWIGHLVAMRQWMRDRGYRDRPLLVSEFGILMPEMYGYGYDRVSAFMQVTFDWLTTATDGETGYPADADRLVQSWSWYSLDEPAFEGWTSWNHLFDPTTELITPLGLDFGAYTAPLTGPYPGTIDLEPVTIWHLPPEVGSSGSLTVTLLAAVRNGGASAAHDVLVGFRRDGAPAGQATVGFIPAGGSGVAAVEWTGLVPGAVQVTVDVDPTDQIAECDETNNLRTDYRVIGGQWVALPLIYRAGHGPHAGAGVRPAPPPGR